MSKDYIERTRWYVTASKLKTFIKSPEAYFKTYIQEIPLREVESKAFLIGSAFDDYLSHGAEYFFAKYFLDQWLLVADMKELCIEKGIEMDSKETKDSLMKKLYGNYDEKIRLTSSDTENVMGMIGEALRQPLWDMKGEYKAQEKVQCEYKGLKLQGTLDRISVEKWLIRDFKTTSDILKFEYKAVDFRYEISMSFYYALIKIVHDKECDVILDVVQSSYPYPSEVFQYQKEKLSIVFNSIILPALDALAAMHTIYTETNDEKIWQSRSPNALRSEMYWLEAYPILESAIQTSISHL